MKIRINIGFSSMDGIGPKAWDRDESIPAMHNRHPHDETRQHMMLRKSVTETPKGDVKIPQPEMNKQHEE